MFDLVKMRLGAFFRLKCSFHERRCKCNPYIKRFIQKCIAGSPSRVKTKLFDMGDGRIGFQNFDPSLNGRLIIDPFMHAK